MVGGVAIIWLFVNPAGLAEFFNVAFANVVTFFKGLG